MTYDEYKTEVIEHISNRISLELDANDKFLRAIFEKNGSACKVADYFLFELSKKIIREMFKK